METIRTYLENMFMNLPVITEVTRAKEELLQMMEDKYNELKVSGRTENEAVGIVISEFGNLEEIAVELGIDSYLENATAQSNSTYAEEAQSDEAEREISLEEAQEYMERNMHFGRRIGFGVTLCVWSPILIIIWSFLSNMLGEFFEKSAMGIGVAVLLIMVAIGVVMLVFAGIGAEEYDYLKTERFKIAREAEDYVALEEESYNGVFNVSIAVGVGLCIISVIPVVASGVLFQEGDMRMGTGVAGLLFLVGIAVFLFIQAGIRKEGFNILQQRGEYSYSKKLKKSQKEREERIMEIIGSFYWPIITCAYLLYSFRTGRWGTSWVIWPIAGILFGAISGIINGIVRIGGRNQS